MAGRDHQQIEVRSRAELRAWLMANHAQPDSIWLVTYRKDDPAGWHVTYDEIVEEALCFGWIDSLPRRLDERRTMLRLSPRKPKSGWSQLNKSRVAKLEAAGQMADPGRQVIAAAKRSGAWEALDHAASLQLPDDLAAAFTNYANAAENFAAFPPGRRRAILEWLGSAKRPETRAQRVEETAKLAAQNIRVNEWRSRAAQKP